MNYKKNISDLHYNQVVSRRYAEVSEKLQSEEILSRQRANELQILRGQFNNLLHMVLHSNKSINRLDLYSLCMQNLTQTHGNY